MHKHPLPATSLTGSPEIQAIEKCAAIREAMEFLQAEGVMYRYRHVRDCITDPNQNSILRTKLFFGTTMEVDIREAVSQQLYMRRSFEENLSLFFLRFLTERMTFFDIGAHFGYFSLLAEHRVGPTGRVVAFEPMPETRERLLRNVAPFPAVKVEPYALWHKKCPLRLNDYGADWSAFNSIGSMRTDAQYCRNPVNTVTVEATTLDAYCEDSGTVPDVVKIDAEGAELQIVHGMQRLLKSTRPVITVEVGDFPHLAEAGQPLSRKTLDHLVAEGYILFEATATGPVKHSVRDGYTYDNIIGVPAERAPFLELPR